MRGPSRPESAGAIYDILSQEGRRQIILPDYQ